MDQSKRQTIKRIAGVAAAGTMLSIANNTLASNQPDFDINGTDTDASLSSIRLHTRISAATNDVEVVITNAGEQTARITQMTPSQTTTKRGVFNFAKLMENGDLVLEPGQAVSVPMTQVPVKLGSSNHIAHHASSLSKALRSSFSVITDNASFARVDVASSVRLA